VTSARTPQVQVQVCGPAEPHMTGTLQRGITLFKKKVVFSSLFPVLFGHVEAATFKPPICLKHCVHAQSSGELYQSFTTVKTRQMRQRWGR